jgi:hypothetical protein
MIALITSIILKYYIVRTDRIGFTKTGLLEKLSPAFFPLLKLKGMDKDEMILG